MYTVGSRKLSSVFIAIDVNGSINKIEENWEKPTFFYPRWWIFVYKLNVGSSAITRPGLGYPAFPLTAVRIK